MVIPLYISKWPFWAVPRYNFEKGQSQVEFVLFNPAASVGKIKMGKLMMTRRWTPHDGYSYHGYRTKYTFQKN